MGLAINHDGWPFWGNKMFVLQPISPSNWSNDILSGKLSKFPLVNTCCSNSDWKWI